MGERDIRYEFADFAVYPSRLCFLISTMVANINNFGVVNFYENNAAKNEPSKKAEPVCEDIEPADELSTNSKAADSDKKLFPRITKHAYELGKAQEVEDELRSASVSAPKLVRAIKTNEALGYLDTQNLSSTELYDLLNEHYALSFSVSNFRRYRSK